MLLEAIWYVLYDQSRNAAASDEELSWLRGKNIKEGEKRYGATKYQVVPPK